MKTAPILNLLLGAAFLYPNSVNATCYNPDGSSITNSAFQPCNQVVGAVSMCCGTNWTNGIVAPDVCYPNGLCLNSYQGQPLFWRGSCTDRTWKSPNCLSNLCTTFAENGDPTQNVALTDCGDGSWCCQGGNQTCCRAKLGLAIAATIGVDSSTSAAAQSTSSSVSKARTSEISLPPQSTSSGSPASATGTPVLTTNSADTGVSASPTTSLQPQSGSGGLSTGSKIGIALGVVFAAFLIAVGIGFWTYSKKRRIGSGTKISHPWDLPAQELPVSEPLGEFPERKGPAGFQHEMQGDSPPMAELAATRYSRGTLPPVDRYGSK